MTKWKYVLTVILPSTGMVVFLGSCSSNTVCNTDACYERKLASVDPFKEGEIASWGTEKEVAEKEKQKKHVGKKAEQEIYREDAPRTRRRKQ